MDNTVYNIKNMRNKFLKSYHKADYAKAQQCGETLIEYYKKNKLTHLPEYVSDLYNLACAYNENGIYEKAGELYRSAEENISFVLSRGMTVPGVGIADIYNNLGVVNAKLHRFDTALKYFRKSYARYREDASSSTKDYSAVCYNLGSVYKTLHRFGEAVQSYARSLNARQEKDIAYADNLFNLGICYVENKDVEIGLDYMNKALPIYKEISSDPSEHISALGVYASVLYRTGRYEKALESYSSLIRILKESKNLAQPFFANTLSHLADCYAKLDMPETGIDLKKKALAMIKKHLGPNHIFYSGCLSELGELYLHTRELDKAAALYAEALEIRIRILGIDNEECLGYIQTLAGIYSAMQLYKKAEDLLNYALSNLSPSNRSYTNIVLWLIKLYMETENGDGLNRAYLLFNKVHPEKSFDEMLDMAEDIDLDIR